MSISQSSNIKANQRLNFDNVLDKVTHCIDRGLSWEQLSLGIQRIVETNDDLPAALFGQIQIQQQHPLKYSLLLGFLFKLGIGSPKNEEQALKYWKNDTTSYGSYLVGKCYHEGWGVNQDYGKAF